MTGRFAVAVSTSAVSVSAAVVSASPSGLVSARLQEYQDDSALDHHLLATPCRNLPTPGLFFC